MATTPVSSSTKATTTAADIQAANKSAAQKLLSSLNAGSGVDVASLAQNLVDAERVPKENAINAKISKNESKISGLSAVMFMMDEFKSKLAELKDKSSYNALSASNSNTSALNVTTTNAAVAGTYNIAVSSLAKPQRSISAAGFASSSAPINGGRAFDLALSSARAGVATGSTGNGPVNSFKIASPAFGTTPTTSDFSGFSIKVNGTLLTVPAATEPALTLSGTTPEDLAAALQDRLRTQDPTLSVAASGGGLVITSSDPGKRLSDGALVVSGSATGASAGTPQANPPVPVFMASLGGASFGTVPSVTDFKEFSLTVDGKVLNLRPAPATADMNALAADLQKQIRALDGTDDISVSVSGGSLQFQSSNTSRKLWNPTLSQATTIRLDTGASVGTPTAAGDGISGIRFGTTPQVTDFKSFTVKIGDNVRTIIPAPGAPTVSALAADLQKRLRILEGSDDVSVTANGNDIKIASKSGKQIGSAALTRQNYADSPEGVVSAINDANTGVKAELVNDGSPGSPYKIMVTGASGASEAFSLSSATPGVLGFATSADNQASDAQLTVNGVSYTRKSNTLSDVISGATLELRSTTVAPASVVFTQDTSAVKDKLKALVTAYNDFDNIIKESTDPKSTLDTYGKTLVGDATVKMLRQQIRGMFLGQSSTPGTAITSLGDLGFKTDQKGVLSLDETKLDAALKANYPDIVKALTGNQSNVSTVSTQPAGVIGDTVRRITKLLDTNGPLKTKSTNAETENTKYNADLEKLKTRMESLLARYNKQFASMESLVGSVNSQKTSLKSTFEGMMSMYTSK